MRVLQGVPKNLEFGRRLVRSLVAKNGNHLAVVDATLWFFEAVRSFEQYTGDYEFVKTSLYSVLQDIVHWHVKGTRYGIHVDEDGLLFSGEPGAQLTWMDAKVGDRVVTPRHGKPVEIQALWYNALRVWKTWRGDSMSRTQSRNTAQWRTKHGLVSTSCFGISKLVVFTM